MAESTDIISQKNENNENDKDNANNNKDYEILGEEYPEYKYSFKIIIIRNTYVGKSCLSMRAIKNYFKNDYSTTLGFDYFKYNVKLKGEKDTVIRLDIWDTCGQEIYRALVTNYYKDSSLALLVYSINE